MATLRPVARPPSAIPLQLLFPDYPLRCPNSRPHRTPCFSALLTLSRPRRRPHSPFIGPRCSLQQSTLQEKESSLPGDGKVSAVLFDMDGVLCNSEEPSRMAGVDVFAEMGVAVTVGDFIPFMGTGEANFLGGVAKAKGVSGFDPDAAKKRFFEIYLEKYAKPDSGIGFPGALELITECKKNGLKVAVASSADRIKVDANLAAAGLSQALFDAIVSADAFENLKPAPDIFLTAAKILDVAPSECIVVEDALAGVQAANAAQMRCIALTTTLPEQKLQQAGPVLIREEIGNVSVQDILEMQLPQCLSTGETSDYNGKAASRSSTQRDFVDDIGLFGRLQGSRRNIVRYGSLGIAVSCVYFTVTNWKAMQYASPKGLLNSLFGYNTFSPSESERKPQSLRVQQFMNYLSDFEARKGFQYVPDFPSKLEWLNSSPLQFSKELRGKIVLLDFWTYCCINCMHVLPDLDYLEKKYSNKPFVVVGVHSAKFDNERDSEAIRNAVLRYNVTHPVVNDGEMNLWRDLGINSWPSFVVVGPDGQLLAQLSGEGHKKDLDNFVEASLLFYGKRGLLNNKPIPLALEKERDISTQASPLKFPGKLAVDLLNNRVFISDSNHNRIVVTDLDGNFIVQVGSSGEAGLQDGTFDEATFNHPQGVAYNPRKNLLYVADTENHALREIDFITERVRTLAGNGTKGSDYVGGGRGNAQVLNSPWDVCFDSKNEVVYIAMAGQHQIWKHRTSDEITRICSGDGYERNMNGSSSTNTSFAQPSGISLSPDQEELYVADSESSSIRAVDLKTGGSKLLAGGDPFFAENLFKFGDRDGTGSDALFQHPLGVLCGTDGVLYISDSYNHKIKRLDPVSKRVVTVAGTGKAGYKDAPALSSQLSEPSGLAEIGTGKLLIADTNNNLIRYLDLNSKNVDMRTFELKGVPLPSPRTKSMKRLRRRVSSDAEIIKSAGSSSLEGILYLRISVPDGYHLSKEASSKYDVEVDPPNAIIFEPSEGILNSEGSAVFHFKRLSSSASDGRINCKVYYCKEDEVCLYQSLVFDVPFQQESTDSSSDLTISYTVKPKLPRAQSAFFQ